MSSQSADAAGSATFDYDAIRGVPKTAKDPLTGATGTYTYDNARQLKAIDWGSGNVKETFDYNAIGRLSLHDVKSSAGAMIWSETPQLRRRRQPQGVDGDRRARHHLRLRLR